MLRAVSIGILVAIGAHWGRRLAILFGFCLVLSTPLRAQIILTNGTTKADSIFSYVDTTYTAKAYPDLPWIWEVRATDRVRRMYFELGYCEGISPNPSLFDSIRFFLVNAAKFGLGKNIRGLSLQGVNVTFLSAPIAGDDRLVKHELLHYLLWNANIEREKMHPMPYFARCGITEFYN